jgi:hypothetical protein
MSARSSAACAPTSVLFRRQSTGVGGASSRPEKKPKGENRLEKEREEANRRPVDNKKATKGEEELKQRLIEAEARANRADATNALLAQQVADLTQQVKTLIAKLEAREKQEALGHQLADNNNQMRDLFAEATAEQDPVKKQALCLQMAKTLPALGARLATVSAPPARNAATNETQGGKVAAALHQGRATEEISASTATLHQRQGESSDGVNYAAAAAVRASLLATDDAEEAMEEATTSAATTKRAASPDESIEGEIDLDGGEWEDVESSNGGRRRRKRKRVRGSNSPRNAAAAPRANTAATRTHAAATGSAITAPPANTAAAPANETARANAAAAPANSAARANAAAPQRRRAFAFVIIGLTEQQKQQYALSAHSLFGVSNSTIRRANLTKNGNLIVEPADETSRALLQAAPLPANLKLKPLEGGPRAPATSQYIILKGVHPDIDAVKMEEILQLPCKRIFSATNGGKPTHKVKLTVKDPAKQKEMFEKGATVGSLHFTAAPYLGDNTGTFRCHKCYSPGHPARECPHEGRLCRRCGGDHLVKDCTSLAACINCGGAHEATNPSCPVIVASKDKKEARTLTYATAARRSGDKVEMLQLAGCIASCLVAYNRRTAGGADMGDIFKDVASSVSATYRVSLKATHIKAQALQIADPSDAAQYE